MALESDAGLQKTNMTRARATSTSSTSSSSEESATNTTTRSSAAMEKLRAMVEAKVPATTGGTSISPQATTGGTSISPQATTGGTPISPREAADVAAASGDDDPMLAGLTEAQVEAVKHGDGPMLVLAAAGSGKTLVITRRIARLIARHIVRPWEILALTFTNKAAGEMRRRVEGMLPASMGSARWAARGLTMSTFHALGARLLRRFATEAGLVGADYSIYDAGDQRAAMKEAIGRLGLSTSNFPVEEVLSAVSRAKNKLEGPEEMQRNARDFWEKSAASAAAAYAKILRAANAVDFDDLLLYSAKLLRENEEVRRQLQGRFRHVLIDEYQDTSHAQFVIAHTLAAGSRNICVVGDPDQSIYGWRGADLGNIMEFQKHYPDAVVVTLGENFRSTAPILHVADHLIKHNRLRLDKPLTTKRERGTLPAVVLTADEHQEAEVVARFVRALSEDEDVAWKDMAVFYRTNALSRVLEAGLRDAGIPYTIVRGTAFYERQEIKDALAYLRVIVNTQDEVSLKRIVNTPTRGIGKTTMDRIELVAVDKGVDLFSAMERGREWLPDLAARAGAAIERFVGMVRRWREVVAGGEVAVDDGRDAQPTGRDGGAGGAGSLAEFVARVITESGMEGMYQKSRDDEDAQRLGNLNELVSSALEFETERRAETARDGHESGEEFDPFAPEGGGNEGDSGASVAAMEMMLEIPGESGLRRVLRAYLEWVALVSDVDALDPEAGAVTLMTLHAAKGLEYRAVTIVGLEEGLLPHGRSRNHEAEVEEERRLFFVGITRAREHLMVTHAETRMRRGIVEPTIPSRFLDDLPEEGIERLGRTNRGDRAVRASAAAEMMRREMGAAMWEEGEGEGADVAMREVRKIDDDGAGVGGSRGEGEEWQYPIGCLVRHPQFGLGRIESVSIAGRHTRLRVRFNETGTKTLIAQYARLERVALDGD